MNILAYLTTNPLKKFGCLQVWNIMKKQSRDIVSNFSYESLHFSRINVHHIIATSYGRCISVWKELPNYFLERL